VRARDLKRWRSGDPVSYAFGAFCVLHLLARRPHPRHQPRSGIEVVTDARTVESLSRKGNTWVLAAFGPWTDTLSVSTDHVLLVAPSDPGNLGAILRTMAGPDVHDLAVVPPRSTAGIPG
jgi:TrmH family RNA methyltransferase